MMKIMLLDDDRAVLDLLTRIITKTGTGTICSSWTEPLEALGNLNKDRPDIVLVDLLMPEMDGISFVRQAGRLYPDAAYIMLSQVTDKQMLAAAYDAGIQFFIQKPVNSVEVTNVLRNVYEQLRLRRTMDQMSQLIAPASSQNSRQVSSTGSADADRTSRQLRSILSSIGILGQRGCEDIIQVCEAYMDSDVHLQDLSLKEVCSRFSDAPKSMEQRMRRAATLGLVNLANMGIEDYSNDVFVRYAAFLYGFDQVRTEMNCIQGKTAEHGVVKIRQFLSALIYASKE